MTDHATRQHSLLFCFLVFAFWAAVTFMANAKETDLSGKWAGTFSCGDTSAGKVTIDIATEHEATEGLLKFDSPQMEGSLKVKVRSGEGGRIAFLPVAWVDQPKQAAMPTLVGTLNADAITGTLSGCKGNAAISLMREAEPEQVAIQADDLLEPAPISGGIAQGHWQGTLTCKRSERKPIESFPVEADIVQDGNGVAALFGIRIPLTPGNTSGPTQEHAILVHGLLSENGLKLSDPTYLARGSGWRFKGLDVTFGDGGQSAHGTPDMNKCDSIALTKVGPPITPQIPKEWAGLWQGMVGRTRSTIAFVPQANPALVELRSEFPTTAPIADQGHLVAAMVPFYAKNGKVLLVLAGTRAGTGEFRNAYTSNAGKHDYIHTRAFLIGAQEEGAIILSRVHWDEGLQNFFNDPAPMGLDTEHADLLLKRVDATSAQLMASGKKPPLSLAGSLGGALAQASTLEDQCGVLEAWIKPSVDRGGGKLTYEAMLDAFRDDPFVSVFGLPFPLLEQKERRSIVALTRHCRKELGAGELSSELTDTFAIDGLHKNAVKAMDARIATTGWRDDKRKEIAALPDEPGSLAKLKQIEAESRKANFTQAERDQFRAELAARSVEIEGALLRRSVADVLNAPGGTNTLDELGALRRKIADSGVSAEIKQELTETVVVKAKTMATTLYNEAVAKAIAAPRSLEGLATIHSIRLSMARLAKRMQTDFGIDRGDSLKSTLALEWAMLSDPAVQSAFRDKMMAVEPDGDPVDSVREVASTYLDPDRLGDNSPPFGAYTRAVEEASARAEITSIDFQDVSGMTSPDEPTAEEMLKLVLQRVHRVNDGMHDRMERCRANNYQNDPVLAVTCIQLFPVIIGQPHNSEFRIRLKSFSKLGCVAVSGNTQFDCQFETALSSNIDQSMGELGRIFSTPGVQTARMVHNADGGWSMIY